MKYIFSTSLIIAGLFFLLTNFIQSQSDPFRINETGPRTVQSNDIFINWIQNNKSYQKVYRLKTEGIYSNPDSILVDTLFTKTSKREDIRPAAQSYNDVASGKFNKSHFDNTISIWLSPTSAQKIEIMISKFDTTGFFTSTSNPTLEAGETVYDICVKTGDFDTDSLDEFLIAYRDASDSVIICLYDVDSTLQATQINRTSTVKLGAIQGASRMVRYYIETADLNGDGKDEITLFTKEGVIQDWELPINVRVYSIVNNNFIAKGTNIIQTLKPPYTLWEFVMGSSKGQFDNDDSDELIFGSITQIFEGTDTYRWVYSIIVEASEDLQTITLGLSYANSESFYNAFVHTPFCVAAGDLNDDGIDEGVLSLWADAFQKNIIQILKAEESSWGIKLEAAVQGYVTSVGANDYTQSNNFIQVGDINMDNKEDITFVKHYDSGNNSGFWIESITCPDASLTQIKTLARMVHDEPLVTGFVPYSISIGDYDGYDFAVGVPTLFHEYGIVQPILTLNAPPVHFDIFDGTIYDVNTCYNGGNCDFWAIYKKETTTSVEVSTEVHKDWDLSSGLKYDGSVSVTFGIAKFTSNYRAWALGNYGEHFSKDNINDSTISIRFEVTAREDDRIYSTICDYDVWEYPIINRNELLSAGSYFVLVPKNVQSTWYSNKSYFALNSVPDHEVGNILSYYPYDTLSSNPNLSEVIRANYSSDKFELDGSSNYDWFLSISDFQQSGASQEKHLGFDAGVEMGGIATNYKFSNSRMTTHKTSITNLIKLNVHLGNVNTGLGEVSYRVTPYAYWGTNDVLTLDYAVEPSTAPTPGHPLTWWDTHYGNQPDPAFILPWRYDPEKGYTLGDPDKRFHTRDITFIPKNPTVGDTLTITARLRNFSLKPTPSPITVSFYLDDPDSGGTPLIGVNGNNSIITNGVIDPQKRSDVNFRFVVPSGFPPFPRIYAVIDQENAIAEIHENNNKGFNVLGASSIVGIDDENYILPVRYMLYQSFPNPFNPTSTIRYSINEKVKVSLKIFDILGREISTLVNEEKAAGRYEVSFNADGLASGVYFYRLQAGDFVQTKKMILIK